MRQMLFFSLQFVYLISDGLVCDEEVDEDGNEEPPAELPVDAGRDVHHELDVPVRSSHRYPSSKARLLCSQKENGLFSLELHKTFRFHEGSVVEP